MSPDPHSPVPAPAPIKPGLGGALKELLSTGPLWLRVAVALALAILGGVSGGKACKSDPPKPADPPQPIIIKIDSASQANAVGADIGAVEARRIGQRFVGNLWRHRVVERMQKDGLAIAGGDATPLSREKAEAIAAHLDDGTIYGAGKSFGAFGDQGDRPFLDWIRGIAQWIKDHPEEAQAFLKLLFTILLAFI